MKRECLERGCRDVCGSVACVMGVIHRRLSAMGSCGDHEDDVQDAMVGLIQLVRRSEASFEFDQLVALAQTILRRRRVDRLRRPLLRLLGNLDDAVEVGSAEAPRLPPIPQGLALMLRRNGVQLLEAWLSGCRTKHALARRLQTSPASIRRRWRRMVVLVEDYLRIQRGMRVE